MCKIQFRVTNCSVLQHAGCSFRYQLYACSADVPLAEAYTIVVGTCLAVDFSSLSDFIDHLVLQTRLSTLLF